MEHEQYRPDLDDDGPEFSLVDLLTWVGEGKWIVGAVTVAVAVVAAVVALLMPNEYTARATLLPPQQQQGGASAALAALGALGGLAGGLAQKTPDEMYVALLKSDSVLRALDSRFALRQRWHYETFEQLRKGWPSQVRVNADRKSSVITVEVDDEDPKFAAELANAHASEITKVLDRLAVSEAQQRRQFFELQLKDTKERLVQAETDLRKVQESSGLIVLDKQAEALIEGVAQLRALIAEREVQLKVLRTAATERNPDVMRLQSELRALRSELTRMESATGGTAGSAVDIPVGKLPQAGIEYVRARRELKIQETLLESMIRQFEIAKLDEAKEGPLLQQVDVALPPDRKSKPQRSLIVLASALVALLLSSAFVIMRRWRGEVAEQDPQRAEAWTSLGEAWRIRRR